MPDRKTSKPATDDVVREIESDPANPPQDMDPLLSQGLALPGSIQGSEGSRAHDFPAGQDQPDDEGESFDDDEDLGGGRRDASELTAD